MPHNAPGALGVGELSLTPDEIASRGLSVVLPGDLYAAMVDTLDVMLRVSKCDDGARTVLTQLRDSLVNLAVPVKSRAVASAILPGLPG